MQAWGGFFTKELSMDESYFDKDKTDDDGSEDEDEDEDAWNEFGLENTDF